MRDTFKSVAYEILKEEDGPLHSAEITQRALRRGFRPEGKTPAATMAAVLYVDINTNGNRSPFIKAGASTFSLNPRFRGRPFPRRELSEPKILLSPHLSSKQKGDIAEARIAELITLYGKRALACYRPVSDDEGIDLLVKQKGKLGHTVHVQIKSRFGSSVGHLFTATTKAPSDVEGHLAFVFCHFDTDHGDLWSHLWYVPASAFLRDANRLSNGSLGFVASMNPDRKRAGQPTKWNEFLIEKRQLADKIIETMSLPPTRSRERKGVRR